MVRILHLLVRVGMGMGVGIQLRWLTLAGFA